MYLALYRKYRSKTFNTIIGQEHITEILKYQVEHNEVSHAYLFCGTRGTGKTSVAKIMSRAVNCLEPQNGNPCNECEICKGILSDRVMDVVEMDAASNNGVDDIRELKEKVIYPAGMCRYKVYIIDEVHMLSRGAFNALLKILEEPPKHLIFILATTEPEKIPQTILSRCQRFNFKRLSIDEIKENLRSVAKLEDKEVEEEVFTLIANNSDGAMRDALSLLDQCFSYTGPITYENASEILGFIAEQSLFELCDEIIRADLKKSLEIVGDAYNQGKDLNQFIKDLLFHFRNLMICKEAGNVGEIIAVKDFERFQNQSSKISTTNILNAISIINDLSVQAKYALDIRLIVEMGIVKLTRLLNHKESEVLEEKRQSKEEKIVKPLIALNTDELQENIKGISEEKSKIDTESKVERVEKSDIIKSGNNEITDDILESSHKDNLNIEMFKRDWEKILQEIKAMRRFDISALLIEATPINYENNMLVLGFDKKFDFHIKAMEREENKALLQSVLNKLYNRDISLRITVANEDIDRKAAIDKLESIFGTEIIERK